MRRDGSLISPKIHQSVSGLLMDKDSTVTRLLGRATPNFFDLSSVWSLIIDVSIRRYRSNLDDLCTTAERNRLFRDSSCPQNRSKVTK